MSRTIRNTIAGFVIFIYGCLLNFFLIMTLKSEPTQISFAVSMLFGAAASFIASTFATSYNIGIHFWLRNILLFVLITILQIGIWYLICEGSFQWKA